MDATTSQQSNETIRTRVTIKDSSIKSLLMMMTGLTPTSQNRTFTSLEAGAKAEIFGALISRGQSLTDSGMHKAAGNQKIHFCGPHDDADDNQQNGV
jgi:hypothetical protein